MGQSIRACRQRHTKRQGANLKALLNLFHKRWMRVEKLNNQALMAKIKVPRNWPFPLKIERTFGFLDGL